MVDYAARWIMPTLRPFLVGNPSAPPLATKFLDKEAAQGARVTFQCLHSNEEGNCSSLYA